MYNVEKWWKNLGCYDREQVSLIKYKGQDNYLAITDDWWSGLNDEEKVAIYEDFFDEY